MESAFGVMHTITKSLKPGHLKALQSAEKTIGRTANSQKGYYAQNRINLNAMGKKGRKSRYGDEDTASFKAWSPGSTGWWPPRPPPRASGWGPHR